MIRNAVLAVALATAAAGCAHTGTPNIDAASPNPGDKGLLVASLTASGYNPGTLSFQVVPVGEPGRTVAMIPVNDQAFGIDWPHGDPAVPNGGSGRLAVIELPPGEYELRRGIIEVSMQERYSSVRRYGYRFTIASGKATYFGNVHVELERSPAGQLLAHTNVLDRRRRDVPLLLKKYASLKPEQIVYLDDLEHQAVLERSGESTPAKLDDLERLLPRKGGVR